jgi:hypothetical protein
MSLKNSGKDLTSILARSVIFVSFAVMIGAGSVLGLKNAHANHHARNESPLYYKPSQKYL